VYGTSFSCNFGGWGNQGLSDDGVLDTTSIRVLHIFLGLRSRKPYAYHASLAPSSIHALPKFHRRSSAAAFNLDTNMKADDEYELSRW
jgi:hypothetical protein